MSDCRRPLGLCSSWKHTVASAFAFAFAVFLSWFVTSLWSLGDAAVVPAACVWVFTHSGWHASCSLMLGGSRPGDLRRPRPGHSSACALRGASFMVSSLSEFLTSPGRLYQVTAGPRVHSCVVTRPLTSSTCSLSSRTPAYFSGPGFSDSYSFPF